MTEEEKLVILNTIQIESYDTDSDVLYTVTCLDNKENRDKLGQLGYSDEQINQFAHYKTGHIEMTHFVWNIATSAELGDMFIGWCIK